MKRTTMQAIIFGITLYAAGEGHCDSLPEKIIITRENAVLMAISKNIDLRSEVLNFSIAEKDVAKSRGIYNPVFSASATGGITSLPGENFKTKSTAESIGLTQSLPTGGSITASVLSGYTDAESVNLGVPTKSWETSAGITVTQPLMKNAGKETTELNITLAASTLQDSQERFRFATTDTVFSVITTYNRLYTLRQELESKLAALKSAQDFLDEIKKKVPPGAQASAPRPHQSMELANTEFAIAQRQKEIVDAERTVRDIEASFRLLIGMEAKAELFPTDPPSREEPQITEEKAVKMAQELRPDLKQLRRTVETSRLQERIARRQSLPDLSITGGGGITGFGPNFGNSMNHSAGWWSAGMQFNYPLGNTAAENEYLKSKIRTEQIQYQIRSFEWKIQNEVEADMRALISARLQMRTTDKAREFAEQRLEEYRKNNRAGTATVQDVINAENDMSSARNAQNEAIETFAYNVTKLRRDTGELLDQQGVHINAAKPASPMGGKEDAVPAAQN